MASDQQIASFNAQQAQALQRFDSFDQTGLLSPEQRIANSLPDLPMQDPSSAMLRMLVEVDPCIPTSLVEKYNAVFSRDVVLGFLDDTRKRDKLIGFDILKLHTLATTPFDEYTFDKELEWNLVRLHFESRLERAQGFAKNNNVNERVAQQSQFSENRQISNDENFQASRPGLMSKVWNGIMRR